MKQLAALVLLLLAFTASAGFFRPLPNRAEPVVETAVFTCSMRVRYNIATPTFLEITYTGGAACLFTNEDAMRAAAAPKLGGEAAVPPVYQCAIEVNYEPVSADAPDVQYTGEGCEATRATALQYATLAVACNHRRLAPCPGNLLPPRGAVPQEPLMQ